MKLFFWQTNTHRHAVFSGDGFIQQCVITMELPRVCSKEVALNLFVVSVCVNLTTMTTFLRQNSLTLVRIYKFGSVWKPVTATTKAKHRITNFFMLKCWEKRRKAFLYYYTLFFCLLNIKTLAGVQEVKKVYLLFILNATET